MKSGKELVSFLTSWISICGVAVESVTIGFAIGVTLFTRFAGVDVTFFTETMDSLVTVADLADYRADERLRVAIECLKREYTIRTL